MCVWGGGEQELRVGFHGPAMNRLLLLEQPCMSPNSSQRVSHVYDRWFVFDTETKDLVTVHTDGNEQLSVMRYSPGQNPALKFSQIKRLCTRNKLTKLHLGTLKPMVRRVHWTAIKPLCHCATVCYKFVLQIPHPLCLFLSLFF